MRAAAVLALLALATACGGGSSSNASTVSKNDLAIMVLPAAELEGIANGLEVDPDSGFQDAAAVAEDTIDPNDTEQDIDGAGLRADYQLTYVSEDMQVNSEVALFGSAEEASEFVAATVGDAEKYEGTDIEGGATLTSVDVAEVDEPGDSAWEGTATATIGGIEGSTAVVAFTIDNVAGSVSITRLGEPVSTADVRELAQKLATRIESVAAGEISETPVPVPAETTSTTAGDDPALERMVLELEDLPAGVSVESDGFVTDGGDVSFERDFALGNATIGKSELIGLQSNVERMGSAAQAALAVRAVSGVVQGPEGKKLFSGAFAEGAGFDAESLEIKELPAEGIGDAATVLHATFDSRAGPFEAVLVFIASGDVSGQIYAAAAKGRIFPDDILALARTMAQKMEAER